MPNESSKSGHVVTFINYLVIASLVFIVAVLVFVVALRLKEPVIKSLSAPALQVPQAVNTDIQSWVSYDNTMFNVSFDMPAGWKVQDYSVFLNNGSGLVAFSPHELPCGTCSYLNDGYFSLRVYNQQTDPALYAIFAEKVKRSQDNPTGFKNMTLDGKTGLVYQNSVVVENEGMIYELSLDENMGKDAIEESPVLKHIFTTWKFTKLFH